MMVELIHHREPGLPQLLLAHPLSFRKPLVERPFANNERRLTESLTSGIRYSPKLPHISG